MLPTEWKLRSVNATVAKQWRSDAMDIKQVAEVLAPTGLGAPVLNVLVPNESNYTALLMQPHGEIEASVAGVRNRDRCLSHQQYGKFLDDARETQADLVITPEYSMPWESLVSAIKEGRVPAEGKLWALGCESIKLSELEALKQGLAPSATLLYETLVPDPGRFIYPLAYVFLAAPANHNGTARTVVLVQFKTFPMGDPDHFEINGLQRGTRVYQFGGIGKNLKLVSLICSDALAFEDAHAKEISDRALVIHIQLTPKPRQDQYRQYRDRLLRYKGDATELICLNWAKDAQEWCREQSKPWHNIAGSAWYLRPDEFDDRDATLCANHRRGLYYTWLQPLRVHALFFNFEPATYLLVATKVAHITVPAAISRRRGPQLTKSYIWDDSVMAWVEQVAADDGFSVVVGESGEAKDEIQRIANNNPLEAERVLALCAGKIVQGGDWHMVQQLDSCVIDSSEVILRLTFCQDTHQVACDFRVKRLKRCGNLFHILKTTGPWPEALADLKKGFRFDWSPDFPHQNAISADGRRATVIYMGEEASATQIDEVRRKAAEYLHRKSAGAHASLLAKQRLAVWSRENGELVLHEPYRYVMIDQTGDTSEVDVGRET